LGNLTAKSTTRASIGSAYGLERKMRGENFKKYKKVAPVSLS
jgi:hypothetical protein